MCQIGLLFIYNVKWQGNWICGIERDCLSWNKIFLVMGVFLVYPYGLEYLWEVRLDAIAVAWQSCVNTLNTTILFFKNLF